MFPLGHEVTALLVSLALHQYYHSPENSRVIINFYPAFYVINQWNEWGNELTND